MKKINLQTLCAETVQNRLPVDVVSTRGLLASRVANSESRSSAIDAVLCVQSITDAIQRLDGKQVGVGAHQRLTAQLARDSAGAGGAVRRYNSNAHPPHGHGHAHAPTAGGGASQTNASSPGDYAAPHACAGGDSDGRASADALDGYAHSQSMPSGLGRRAERER